MEKSETHGWQHWIKMENQRYLIAIVGSDGYTWKITILEIQILPGITVQVLQVQTTNTCEIM
jgi:hypothetical protein